MQIHAYKPRNDFGNISAYYLIKTFIIYFLVFI